MPGDATTVDTQTISCGNGIPGGVNCVPSKKDLKEAHNAYARGLKLENHQRLAEAFAQFDEASRLVPQNPQFFSAREVAKSQLVFQHTERGEALLANAQQWQAAAEFRAALKLDPDNDYMQQRLDDALRSPALSALGEVPADAGRLPAKSGFSPKPSGPRFTTAATFAACLTSWPQPMA